MANLVINKDFIGWTKWFLLDEWRELVFINPKNKMETR